MRSQSFLLAFLSAFLGVLFFLQGCATTRQSPESRSDLSTEPSANAPAPAIIGPMGPPESFGPPIPEAPSVYGPEPVHLRPVVLVLGPGLARGFTCAGVFRALYDAKIPIGAILGTEMGGLMGALYALSPSINQFEWALFQLKSEVFARKKNFFLGKKEEASDGKEFESLLKKIFEDKDLAESKIQVQLGLQVQGQDQAKERGAFILVNRGKAAQVLRGVMANPKIFTPGQWEDHGKVLSVISAETKRPFLIREAKELGIGPVVVIDAIPDSEAALAREELREADLVIKPKIHGIDSLSFQKKTDAAFRGKSATIENMAELRHLVGLPELESGSRGP